MSLPLLGERVGVRGKGANSNPRSTAIPGTVKLRKSPAEPGGFQFDYEFAAFISIKIEISHD
jgi:hypothetical protein